jgi:hypothetical protein
VLQIIPNITHEESFPLTLKVFNSHDQNFSNLELSEAVCYRELTRKWASVSPINPWSDTRETLQLLRHCWNAWRHYWRGHVTPPRSCIMQVFIAVAWQQTRRGDAMRGDTRLVTARLGSARHGENTASSTVAYSRERVSMLQFFHGVNTPQYIHMYISMYVFYSVINT